MRVQAGRRRGSSHARVERRGLWQATPVQNHRDLNRLCAGPVTRKYCNTRSNQRWHWCYALVLGALSSRPIMSGMGLLPCLGRHFLRPENGAELPPQCESRHSLVCDQRLSAARPESQCTVIIEIGGTHQSGLGTEGVRLLWSRYHRCCRQVGVHG